MDIRPYSPADRDACLEIFDSNASENRPKFAAFLNGGPGPFFVAEHAGEIVACGGFEVNGDSARLHWGMVRRKWQRRGLGRLMLFYRMREITRNSAVQTVGLEAPRQAAPFFTGQGFREVTGDGERVELVKRLVVCP
ncbi:MAG: GNAT family N-acetyltransferase [Bryobacteraceae bacterium]